jgi:predicted TIM-barrel fold metal-dependent hydrolase
VRSLLAETDGAPPTAARLLEDLDARGVERAVLYPGALRAAYGRLDGDDLAWLCERYDDWVLDLVAPHADRLRAVALLHADDAAAAASRVAGLAARGAAGAIVPLVPHTERRYDDRRYDALWSALEQAEIPVVFCRGTGRGLFDDPEPFDLALHRVSHRDPLFDALLDALEVSYARLAVVAMIFSGVFARHPGLRVVVTGFGAGWVPYTMIRMDGQYEVRPERAGSDEADPGGELEARHAFAREHEGFQFPPGVRPSDHFRRHVHVTAEGTPLDRAVKGMIGSGR